MDRQRWAQELAGQDRETSSKLRKIRAKILVGTGEEAAVSRSTSRGGHRYEQTGTRSDTADRQRWAFYSAGPIGNRQ